MNTVFPTKVCFPERNNMSASHELPNRDSSSSHKVVSYSDYGFEIITMSKYFFDLYNNEAIQHVT